MVNIQLYVSKKNFDTQKAERFFKERRITVQLFDLKKRAPGERELQNLARGAGGLNQLIDRDDPKVREHPACYFDRDDELLPAVMESPWLLKSPIARCGREVTVGNCPEVWKKWLEG